MRVIYRKIRHARYLYIKRNFEKVWGARYTLGGRYLSKNTVTHFCFILDGVIILFLGRPKQTVEHVLQEIYSCMCIVVL